MPEILKQRAIAAGHVRVAEIMRWNAAAEAAAKTNPGAPFVERALASGDPEAFLANPDNVSEEQLIALAKLLGIEVPYDDSPAAKPHDHPPTPIRFAWTWAQYLAMDDGQFTLRDSVIPRIQLLAAHIWTGKDWGFTKQALQDWQVEWRIAPWLHFRSVF